jgi:hypothetical protein
LRNWKNFAGERFCFSGKMAYSSSMNIGKPTHPIHKAAAAGEIRWVTDLLSANPDLVFSKDDEHG